MVESPNPTLPTAENKQHNFTIGNDTKNANMIYVPRQVFLSDNFLSTTTTSLVNIVPKVLGKKSNIVSIKSEDNKHGQESGSSETNWSPLMDGIICALPARVTGDSNSVDKKTQKDSQGKNGKMAEFDEYIDGVLYGHGKSSLPVFEYFCRQ